MIIDKTFEEVYKEHYGLLWSLVKKRMSAQKNPRYDFEDLFQVASIVLYNSYNNFDPDRGVKFTTYLTKSVNGALSNYIVKNHSEFSVGGMETFAKHRKEMPDTLNLDDIIVGTDHAKFNELFGVSNDLTDSCVFSDIRKIVNDDRLYYMWYQHFFNDKTYEELGIEFNLSRQRAEQLVKNARKRIQKNIKRSDFYD